MQDQIIRMKRAESIFNKGRSAKLDYEMLINNITDDKKQNQCHLANFLPISGVKPYPHDTIYFSRKQI